MSFSFGRSMEKHYLDALLVMEKRYGKAIGAGNTRIVFASKTRSHVIKVPYSVLGEIGNSRELHPDNWLGRPSRYAKTWRNNALHNEFGFLVICMEWVRPTNLKRMPDWTSGVDCRQVGYNRDGRLVAYDWG